jgi:hypothetical protein
MGALTGVRGLMPIWRLSAPFGEVLAALPIGRGPVGVDCFGVGALGAVGLGAAGLGVAVFGAGVFGLSGVISSCVGWGEGMA